MNKRLIKYELNVSNKSTQYRRKSIILRILAENAKKKKISSSKSPQNSHSTPDLPESPRGGQRGGYCSFQEQMPKRANLVKAIFNSFSNDFQTSLKRFSTYSQSFFNCFSTVFQVNSHLDFHVKTRKIRDIYSNFMPEGFEIFRISTSCVILAGQAWS